LRDTARRLVSALVALVSLGSSNVACAQDVASADHLIRQLYVDLGHLYPHHPLPPLWWSALSARTKARYDRLRALDKKSGDLTIDWVWLCQCQDVDAFHLNSLTVSNTSANHASAIVRFRLGPDRQTLRLLLVREGTWKIDDMVNDRGRHFTDDLQAGLDGYARR